MIARRIMLISVKNGLRLLIGLQLLLALAYTLPLFSSELIADSDFISFYTGWSIVRDGGGARLYDAELQHAYQAELWGTEAEPSHPPFLPFVNPPHAAFIFMPLSYFAPTSAAFIFLGLNCLIGIWVLRRLWQLAAGWTRSARVLLITTVLGTEIFWYGLATRTISLIVFACLIEYYRAMTDGRDVKAGLWLFWATIKPQLVLLPALIPLARQRWRLLVIVISLGISVAVCISFAFGVHIWTDYMSLLSEVSVKGESYGASPLLMNNLRMLLHRTLPAAAVLPVVYVGLVAGMVSTIWLWRSTRAFELKFALTILLGLCLAPHLNYQDTLVAFLPASIIYDWARLRSKSVAQVFQWLPPIATLAPAILIFSGYSRSLRWIWPVPLILILIGLCVTALRAVHRDMIIEEGS